MPEAVTALVATTGCDGTGEATVGVATCTAPFVWAICAPWLLAVELVADVDPEAEDAAGCAAEADGCPACHNTHNNIKPPADAAIIITVFLSMSFCFSVCVDVSL